MGMGFAGALAGAGAGLMKWAEDRRKLADELMKMERREEIRREGVKWNAELKAGMRGGGGGGGGRGGRGRGGDIGSSSDGQALTARELDDVNRLYKSAFPEDDVIGDPRPNMAEFQSHIERTRKPGESLSQAAERTKNEWTVQDRVEEVEKPRSALSPMRLFGDDTYTDVNSERVGGFAGAMRDGTPAPSPNSSDGAPSQGGGILDDARAAVAQGADPSAVANRLRENGVNVSPDDLTGGGGSVKLDGGASGDTLHSASFSPILQFEVVVERPDGTTMVIGEYATREEALKARAKWEYKAGGIAMFHVRDLKQTR